jgi:transposase
VGTKLFDHWLSHPTDRSKDFVKLHAAIDDRGAAFAIAITDGTTSDTLVLPFLLNDVDAQMGVVRADAGYLSRDNVQMIEDLGAIPFVKPKRHPKLLSMGRPAWKHMLMRHRDEPDEFRREYNQRWRAEAYFSKLKRKFGPVKSRIGTMRRKEIWMRIIVLNIIVAAGEQIEDGMRVAG